MCIRDSNYTALRSALNPSGSVTLTFPGTAGTNGQVLTTDGAGALSWTTPTPLRTAAETRALLGIGEYADDAAAGTGGVASGAMYYNTTSSDYRLKS